MRAILKIFIPATGFISYSLSSSVQCQILHYFSPIGSMQYQMEPVNFYWSKAESLKGCIVTYKENCYPELEPVSYPEKPEGHKLKKDLELKLSDDKTCMPEHPDTRYLENVTVMEIFYLTDNKDIGNIWNSEGAEHSIEMIGKEGVRTYKFESH